MTYVVTDVCIKCKYTDCVEVCPVDCFYEGENMLVINPDECIDCGVCIPECPIDAIVTDIDPRGEPFLELNREFSTGPWPNLTKKKPGRSRPGFGSCPAAGGRVAPHRQARVAEGLVLLLANPSRCQRPPPGDGSPRAPRAAACSHQPPSGSPWRRRRRVARPSPPG